METSADRRIYQFELDHHTDSDIIGKLSSVPSIQEYIRQLIRQDIAQSAPDTTEDISDYLDDPMPNPEQP